MTSSAFKYGDKVTITSGSMKGQQGEVVKVIHSGWNKVEYRVRFEIKGYGIGGYSFGCVLPEQLERSEA